MVLNILRSRKFSKRILTALLILIIPAFVLWGIGSLRDRPDLVGIIGSHKIFADDYIKSRQGIRVQMILAYYMDSEALRQLMENRSLINLMAWERLILLDAAEKHKIKVSDDDVRNFILRTPLFQRNGQFDPAVYKQIIHQSFALDPRQFEEILRENLEIKKMRQEILRGIKVSDKEVRDMFRKLYNKVDLSCIIIDKDNFIDEAIVQEEEIDAEYKKNEKGFYSPRKIAVEYIEIPFSTSGEKATVLGALESIHSELKNSPGKFHEIADKNSAKYGKTDYFSKEDVIAGIPFSEDFHNTAFRLENGEVSAPVISGKAKGAVYILRKISELPPKKMPLEEVKEELLASLKNSKALVLAKEEALKIYSDITEKGASFQDSALKTPVGLRTEKDISINGYIDNVGPASDVVALALKEEDGAILPPVIVPVGAIITRVDTIHPMDEKEFEKKKESIKQQIISQKQAEALEKWFSENASDTELKVKLNEI